MRQTNQLVIKNGIVLLPRKVAENFDDQILYIFRNKPNGCVIAKESYYKKVKDQIEAFPIETSRMLQRYMFGNGYITHAENSSICIEDMLFKQKEIHAIGVCNDEHIDIEWHE